MMNWLKDWAKPMGVVIITGFIIWLGQLNWHALQSTAKNAEQDLIQQKILEEQVIVSENVAKAALLLSILMDDMKDMRESVAAHHEEAEKWKEKIRQLEKK